MIIAQLIKLKIIKKNNMKLHCWMKIFASEMRNGLIKLL